MQPVKQRDPKNTLKLHKRLLKYYDSMKTYQTKEIKNIALLGSKGSGKTTLAEAMLYECGVIKRRGTVAANNTVCDYFPVEK